jgi:hypothetical protein
LVNRTVSIIIPVYNGSNFLDSAIRSALSQTHDDCEIIVVNDGSNDLGATQKIIDSYGDRILPLVKENGGVATALNLGIASANGSHLLWLSHDDVLTVTAVEDLVQTAELSNSFGAAIVYGAWHTIDEKGNLTGEIKAEKSLSLNFQNSPHLPILFSLVHGCSLLIPTELIRRMGGFDVSLPTTQDYDLFWRMFPETRLLHCSRNTLYQRNHSLQGSNSIQNHLPEADRLWLKFLRDILDTDELDEGSKTIVLFAVSQHLALSGYSEAKRAFLREANNRIKSIRSAKVTKTLTLTLEDAQLLLDINSPVAKKEVHGKFGLSVDPLSDNFEVNQPEFMQLCRDLFNRSEVDYPTWLKENSPSFGKKLMRFGLKREE